MGSEEKKEKSQGALLAGGEKCCKLTAPFLKSSAASASTSANTASTYVSDTVEPAHRGERQDAEEYEPEEDEEVDMDNSVTGKTRFYHGAAGSDDLLICFVHWCCALLWCSCV